MVLKCVRVVSGVRHRSQRNLRLIFAPLSARFAADCTAAMNGICPNCAENWYAGPGRRTQQLKALFSGRKLPKAVNLVDVDWDEGLPSVNQSASESEEVPGDLNWHVIQEQSAAFAAAKAPSFS